MEGFRRGRPERCSTHLGRPPQSCPPCNPCRACASSSRPRPAGPCCSPEATRKTLPWGLRFPFLCERRPATGGPRAPSPRRTPSPTPPSPKPTPRPTPRPRRQDPAEREREAFVARHPTYLSDTASTRLFSLSKDFLRALQRFPKTFQTCHGKLAKDNRRRRSRRRRRRRRRRRSWSVGGVLPKPIEADNAGGQPPRRCVAQRSRARVLGRGLGGDARSGAGCRQRREARAERPRREPCQRMAFSSGASRPSPWLARAVFSGSSGTAIPRRTAHT